MIKIMTFKKKLAAFTLAETLIVVAIIGVVSALTLPNLNNTTGNKDAVAKVKKIYSNFEEALAKAEATYGPMKYWITSDNTDAARTERIAERITEFMKKYKACRNNNADGCMKTGNFTNLGGTNYVTAPAGDGFYTYLLADGSSLSFNCGNRTCSIYMDIDGPHKGKFMYGVDVFHFGLNIADGEIYR